MHLQYADGTLCISEPTIKNLWTLKAIFRGFEMVFGLKVNFWKSSLMGVNVSLFPMTFFGWRPFSLIVEWVWSHSIIWGFRSG
jgi:hypothetical protein